MLLTIFFFLLISIDPPAVDAVSSAEVNSLLTSHDRTRQKRAMCVHDYFDKKVTCFCDGGIPDVNGQMVYDSVSCLLSAGWEANASFGVVPLTKRLVIRCLSRDPFEMENDTFQRYASVLNHLAFVYCSLGNFPVRTLQLLTSLQQFSIANAGKLDDRHLQAISAISTNATVYISRSEIRALNDNSFSVSAIRRHSNITSFSLAYNMIEEIHNGTFAVFPSWKKLYLNNNNITAIDEGAFAGLDNLTELYMSFNPHLPFVQDEEKHFLLNTPSLERLVLTSTGITNITTFSSLRLAHLRTLKLGNNYISELPRGAVASMPMLITVDLSNNSIRKIDGSALIGGLTGLSVVDLSMNRLADIPPILFLDTLTPNVSFVNVSYNLLTEIKRYTFTRLLQMESADLSNNHIHTIEQFAFVNLPKLSLVDLRNNNFVHFSLELVFPFILAPPHVTITILMAGNPFKCGCSTMYSIRTGSFAHNNPFVYLQDNITWQCTSPPPVANRRLMSVPPEYLWCSFNGDVQCQKACDCYVRDTDKRHIFFCPDDSLDKLPEIPADTAIFDCVSCVRRTDEPFTLRPGTIQAGPDLAVLVLRDISITTILTDTFAELLNLQHLDLSFNNIAEINQPLLSNLTVLRILDLSHNRIKFIDPLAFETNIALSQLYLHGNDLETLEPGVFNHSTNLQNLTLHDDPFICNCSLFWLKQWMQSNLNRINRKSLYDVTCSVNISDAYNSSAVSEGETHPIIRVADVDFGCYDHKMNVLTVQEYSALISTLTLTFLFLCGFIAAFRHRRAIRVILYTRYGFHLVHEADDDIAVGDDQEVRWEYDAYIAYSDDDVDFVLERLLPVLEGGEGLGPRRHPRYKLCIRHRDFPPGGCIATTIVACLEASRRSIVLLSRNFLEDEWRLLEFKTSHQRVLQEKRNKNLILVFIDDGLDREDMDEDMRYYVTANAFLSARDRLFEEKLLFEMPINPLAANNQFMILDNPEIH